MVPPGSGGTIGRILAGRSRSFRPSRSSRTGPRFRWSRDGPSALRVRSETPSPHGAVHHGQRVFDVLFPLARAGRRSSPVGSEREDRRGALPRQARGADVIVFVGAGARERDDGGAGGFSGARGPVHGRPLMERTVLVVNTRTCGGRPRGFRLHRDHDRGVLQGYGVPVALLADSISGGRRLSAKSPRAWRRCPARRIPDPPRQPPCRLLRTGGQISCLGAGNGKGRSRSSRPSPLRGGLLGARHAKLQRIAGVFWALDPALAHRRHFPAVDWKKSYSSTPGRSTTGSGKRFGGMHRAPRRLMALLQREEELQEVVQMVGIDALQEQERIVLTVSKMVREHFLRRAPIRKRTPPAARRGRT